MKGIVVEIYQNDEGNWEIINLDGVVVDGGFSSSYGAEEYCKVHGYVVNYD